MTIHRYHEITHWPIIGSNGFGGFTFDTPALIEGRWEERTVRFIGPSGEDLTSKAIAYVPSDIDVGDYLAEGDHTATADPTTLDSAFRAEQFQRITDLRNMDAVRKVMM